MEDTTSHSRRDGELPQVISCWAESPQNFSHALAPVRAQACVTKRTGPDQCVCYCSCLGSSVSGCTPGEAQGYCLDVPVAIVQVDLHFDNDSRLSIRIVLQRTGSNWRV